MIVTTPSAPTLIDVTLRNATRRRCVMSSRGISHVHIQVGSYKGHERWQLHKVAGERVEEPDRGVVLVVPSQEEEAVDRVMDMGIGQERDLDAGENSCGEIEETFLVVTRVKAVTLGEQQPPLGVEARIDGAMSMWGDGAGTPVGADGTKSDIVQ